MCQGSLRMKCLNISNLWYKVSITHKFKGEKYIFTKKKN